MSWRWHLWSRAGERLGGVPIEAVPDPEHPAMVHPPTPITVFDGTPQDWHDYLLPGFDRRHDPDRRLAVTWEPEHEALRFTPRGNDAGALAECLNRSWILLLRHLRDAPHAIRQLRRMVFANRSNDTRALELRTARHLPCPATREVQIGTDGSAVQTVLVLQRRRVEMVLHAWGALDAGCSDGVRLGTAFPLLLHLIASLGYTSQPRDRFVARIALTRRQSIVAINALFAGRRHGRLVPNEAGTVFRDHLARDSGLRVDELDERHPLMLLYHNMAFALSQRRCDAHHQQATILVRQFLEDHYLRPSVAASVPAIDPACRPMPCLRRGRRGATPAPRVGAYGILDREDLRAWRRVAPQFDRIGYVIVRQLGMGQFGRVYEAINLVNSALPPRVALKVDRIGHSSGAIAAPEHAMDLGNRLAMVPHIIRIYDAGTLAHGGINYHVLQLIDGETLDDLLGITGQEHASVSRPATMRASSDRAEREVRIALSGAHGEQWRMRGIESHFAEDLGLGQACDILTSIVLWIQEIHEHGFAINDLKNGNLMLSRRGQLRGIDLDSYAPVLTPIEKVVDFKFLSVAVLLFMLNARGSRGYVPRLDGGLLRDPRGTAALLAEHWTYGPVEELSGGRVTTDAFIAVIRDLLLGCNDGSFAADPTSFAQAVDAFLASKRRVFRTDVILD